MWRASAQMFIGVRFTQLGEIIAKATGPNPTKEEATNGGIPRATELYQIAHKATEPPR